ncbi:phospholipase D-like domain-containing protein [Crenobacter sp. SG2305]|uniref:phospholipase D-like domain-containing protein n=1 Tax=Crenobacter oryzisoli TaxID=3056844 RepID=UPI0025AAD032|nr:phospholipase D-like domain-containing protein [Crenobacter sp. SG2305]MDN0084094.1 phospholipase D-like domain-containing protein [Crenobacter sp. SG2305]
MSQPLAKHKPRKQDVDLSQHPTTRTSAPWFLADNNPPGYKPEFHEANATFQPLINGERAFGAIYDAILAAKHSVDIVCWGFQPSMYFKRGAGAPPIKDFLQQPPLPPLTKDNIDQVVDDMAGKLSFTRRKLHPKDKLMPIGELLEMKSLEGVQVRILTWNNAVGQIPEVMNPGYNVKRGDNENFLQECFDIGWHQDIRTNKNIQFRTRDFDDIDKSAYILPNMLRNGASSLHATATSKTPSHHQKTVLIDYEHPESALGFVMGHNMLDAYWDRDDHHYVKQEPHLGRNGATARHDISSRLTGPVLVPINHNFVAAWDKATGENLTGQRAHLELKHFKPRPTLGTPAMAQIARTQSQTRPKGKVDGEFTVQDIKHLYLNAVNHASQYIYIENQYFRWVNFAEATKQALKNQLAHGRDPGQHGPLYLMVVTNDNEEGMGKGVKNTYKMLDALGKRGQMPELARSDISKEVSRARQEVFMAEQKRNAMRSPSGALPSEASLGLPEKRQKLAELQRKQADAKQGDIPDTDIPGLKTHICSLVSMEGYQPGQPWQYVYIHAKLMMIDDTFMTLGSANINLRSMVCDSEINVCHCQPDITRAARHYLWGKHTADKGNTADASKQMQIAELYKLWGQIMKTNHDNRKNNRAPTAPLVKFSSDTSSTTDLD